MSTDIRLPHRGNAYQPRATLWVCHAVEAQEVIP